jgi:hypothetical protein
MKCITKYCRGQRAPKKSCCHKCIKRRWRAANPERAAYANLKCHARSRGKAFTLTFEEFMGIVGLQSYVDGKGREKHCMSIDRIDPALGYVVGNIRVVSVSENSIAQREHERKMRDPYYAAEYAKRAGAAQEPDPF